MMSIGPNEEFPVELNPFPESGEPVLKMLSSILESPPKVSKENERKCMTLLDIAMETDDLEKAMDMLQSALEFDPLNVDVHLMFLDMAYIEDSAMIPILEKLEAIGKFKLGEDYFNDCEIEFWLMHETRPYMRILEALAGEYYYQGFYEKASATWKRMIDLNPNDNQGVRDHLVLTYLMIGETKNADGIFQQFSEDGENCCFLWGKVLRDCILGESKKAKDSLRAARKQNKYMESFIKGTRKRPDEAPSHYSFGTKEEAECFANHMKDAWSKHPEALKWLKAQKK